MPGADAKDHLSVGTEVTWHYRSAIGHGTIAGIAEEADTSADTKYRIKQHDHHPDEPEIVEHYGRALTVAEKGAAALGVVKGARAGRVQIGAPFTKVEKAADGGRIVHGIATLEVVDKAGEIADFTGTCQAFETWSAEIVKASQGKSRGNVREQHSSNAVAKVLEWRPGEFAGDNGEMVKGIEVVTRVPPGQTAVIEKIDEGILSGFSIGGNYASRTYDATVKATRYVPVLAELSMVDNPAVPGAVFTEVLKMAKGAVSAFGQPLGKADGDADAEREKLRAAAEERAKKYGIGVKDGGSLTPPKGKPADEAEYGDPVNYAYPFDAPRKRAAVARFNDSANREKAGYSEQEWAKIGERIAAGVGDGHTFKDGKIESKEADDAEKAALATAMQKASKGEGLSHDDVRALLCQALRDKSGPFDNDGWWVTDVWDDHFIACDWDDDRYWSVPYTIKGDAAELGEPTEVRQTWEPVEEAAKSMTDAEIAKMAALVAAELGKAGGKKDDEAEDERKAREAKEAKAKEDEDAQDRDDAEKAAQALSVLKSISDRMEKATGKRVPRRKHLMHAIDHIHRAMGNEDEIQDKAHLDGAADEDATAEKTAAIVFAKIDASGVLAKSAAPDLPSLLKVAITEGTNGLAKAEDVTAVAGDLAKALSDLETVKGQVKVIAAQPTSGPFVGAAPGIAGSTAWEGMEAAALKSVQANTTDPLVKHAIGQHLAVEEAKLLFRDPSARR